MIARGTLTLVARLGLGRIMCFAPSSSSPSVSPLVHITPAAVSQLKRIAEDGENLRILVDSGGCSGFEYKLSMDRHVNDDDEVIEQDGAKIVVDQISLGFIKGSKLDFVRDLMRSAFRITDNPTASGGCSCGASFSPKAMDS